MKLLFLTLFSTTFFLSCKPKQESAEPENDEVNIEELKQILGIDSLQKDNSLEFHDTIITLCNPVFDSLTGLLNSVARITKQKTGIRNYDLTMNDIKTNISNTKHIIIRSNNSLQKLKEFDRHIPLKKAVLTFNRDMIDLLENDIEAYMIYIQGTSKTSEKTRTLLLSIKTRVENSESILTEIISKFDKKYRIID